MRQQAARAALLNIALLLLNPESLRWDTTSNPISLLPRPSTSRMGRSSSMQQATTRCSGTLRRPCHCRSLLNKAMSPRRVAVRIPRILTQLYELVAVQTFVYPSQVRWLSIVPGRQVMLPTGKASCRFCAWRSRKREHKMLLTNLRKTRIPTPASKPMTARLSRLLG